MEQKAFVGGGDGGTNRAHARAVWESTFIPHYIEIASLSILCLPLAFLSLRRAERCDLFKGHLNRLSYLGVSSQRWQAQQRNFASGFGFVHSITSQQEPEQQGPS